MLLDVNSIIGVAVAAAADVDAIVPSLLHYILTIPDAIAIYISALIG